MYARRRLPLDTTLDIEGSLLQCSLIAGHPSIVEIGKKRYFKFLGPASFVNAACVQHCNAVAHYQKIPASLSIRSDPAVTKGSEILINYSNEVIWRDFEAYCPNRECKVKVYDITE